jgi:hypothetical protein
MFEHERNSGHAPLAGGSVEPLTHPSPPAGPPSEQCIACVGGLSTPCTHTLGPPPPPPPPGSDFSELAMLTLMCTSLFCCLLGARASAATTTCSPSRTIAACTVGEIPSGVIPALRTWILRRFGLPLQVEGAFRLGFQTRPARLACGLNVLICQVSQVSRRLRFGSLLQPAMKHLQG